MRERTPEENAVRLSEHADFYKRQVERINYEIGCKRLEIETLEAERAEAQSNIRRLELEYAKLT